MRKKSILVILFGCLEDDDGCFEDDDGDVTVSKLFVCETNRYHSIFMFSLFYFDMNTIMSELLTGIKSKNK